MALKNVSEEGNVVATLDSAELAGYRLPKANFFEIPRQQLRVPGKTRRAPASRSHTSDDISF